MTRARRRGIDWSLDLDEGIDFTIYLLGSFEPGTLRAYRRVIRPGFVVLDIGANIGAHTLPFAQLVGTAGRVVAFEPTEFAFAKLQTNIALNPTLAERIQAAQIVLLESPDATPPLALSSSWPLRPTADVHTRHDGASKPTNGARATLLDACAAQANFDRVDLIKLDVDGHEVPILKGAAQVLAHHRPFIVFEFAPYLQEEHGSNGIELLTLLADAGYEFARAPQGPVFAASIDALARSILPGASVNLWAHPA